MPETKFANLGAGALRNVSLADIEKAIGEALSRIVDGRLSVTVQSLEFGSWAQGANLAMTVNDARKGADS